MTKRTIVVFSFLLFSLVVSSVVLANEDKLKQMDCAVLTKCQK